MSEDGVDGDTYLQIARRLGAREILSKPFADVEFLVAVLSVLESLSLWCTLPVVNPYLL